MKNKKKPNCYWKGKVLHIKIFKGKLQILNKPDKVEKEIKEKNFTKDFLKRW